MRRRFSSGALVFFAFLIVTVARAEPPRLFFWQIRSGKATAYLLGSIHVAKPSLYPLDPQIEKAFSNSNVLVVEADASPEKSLGLAVKMLSRASYPPEDGLDKHISRGTCDALVARLSKDGMPAEQVRMFKPWFLASTLMLAELQKLGIQPQYGLDFHFLRAAKGKPVVELEGAEAQIDLLDGFTDAQQEQFLQYTLHDMDNLATNVNDILNAWSTGDVKKVEDYLLDTSKESPEMRVVLAKLFDERNAKMAAKIEQLLQTDRTYFIIVGAGHLVGKNGLLALLGQKHRVEQFRASRSLSPSR